MSARSEASRIKRIIKRLLSTKEYHITDLAKDLENLSERKLKKIRTQRDVIGAGLVKWSFDAWYAKKQAKKKPKKAKTKKAPKPAPIVPAPMKSGVLSISDGDSLLMDRILQQIEEGLDYTGEKIKKPDGRSGFILVNAAAARLERIMIDARMKRTDEEIIKDLLKAYGDIQTVQAQIRRFIRAIYDPIYAKWANGQAIFEADMRFFADVVGGNDTGF